MALVPNQAARAAAALIAFSAALAPAQTPPCLPDSNGDGHPLFGVTCQRADIESDGSDQSSGYPVLAAFGDLNGDGFADAIVTLQSVDNRHIHYMTVVLNAGDAVLRPPVRYSTGLGPRGVELADLDGDGHLDVIVCCALDNTVWVRLGRGDSTLGDATIYQVGFGPISVRAGDLDGDGYPDLVILNDQSMDLSVLYNRGHGNFGPEHRLPVGQVYQYDAQDGTPPPQLTLADLNGDGRLDVAVPAYTSVKLFFNDGAGNLVLTPPGVPLAATADMAVAADFNGDGILDLAVAAAAGSRSLAVALGTGGGRFAAPVWYSVPFGGTMVDAGDIDRDGHVDLLMGGGDGFNVLRNRGDGTFTIESYTAYPSLGFAMLRDLSGDGWPDVVSLSRYVRPCLRVHLNDGDGAPATLERIWIGPSSGGSYTGIAPADLDGDGDVDLAMSKQDGVLGWQVELLRNDGNGVFEEMPHISLAPAGIADGAHIATGDLYGDGRQDLIVADTIESGGFTRPGRIWVVRNLGGFSFAAPVAYPLPGEFPTFVAVGDIDGDGHLDVVAHVCQVYPGNDTTPVERRLLVLHNQGDGTLVIASQHTLASAMWPVPNGQLQLADLDGDGHLDATATWHPRTGVGGVVVLMNRGGTFAPASAVWTGVGPTGLAVCDFNGDGALDLAFTHSASLADTSTTVLQNDGHGNFTETSSSPYGPSLQLLAADFNGDGRPDLALPLDWGALSVYVNESNGLTFPGSYGALSSVQTACAVDVDADGRPDVILAELGRRLTLLRNRACPHPCPADFDGDGRVSFHDFLIYLSAYAAAQPRADLDADGRITIRDFLRFLQLYAQGCS